MAIATLDGALAGMQPTVPFSKLALAAISTAGKPVSYWAIGGTPGVGAYDATVNGANCTNATVGALQHVDPGTGVSYLGRLTGVSSAQPGVLMLCDRLYQGRPLSTTGAQTITQPTLPARDNAGTTNGDGVQLALEYSTAATVNTATLSLTYTNQAGTGSRAATFLDAAVGTAAIGTFQRIQLQAGDTGARSVQSLTLSAAITTGVINLVAYRVLAAIELPATGTPNAIDALTGGFPKIFNGSCPFFVFVPSATTATALTGTYNETQG